ncbi:hypothetical protein AGR9A_Lc50093 [Agrobacterium salinitolerans str. Hayward 0363]|nr:hypothetical protein AGR9A_Lc50093 [Agrobacterium salinitolerans str. Hayward 0363]
MEVFFECQANANSEVMKLSLTNFYERDIAGVNFGKR